MSVTAFFSQAVTRRRNRALQQRLQEKFAKEARREAALSPEQGDALLEQVVWQRLEASIPFLEPNPVRTSSKIRPSLFLGSALVTALLAIALVWNPAQIETPVNSWDGIKGDSNKAIPVLTGLRYALVHNDGSIVPGSTDLEVPERATIVFSLEGQGVSAEGVPVVVEYQKMPFADMTIISEYTMRTDREIMRGDQGYIAFRPSEAGTYLFRARVDSKNKDASDVTLVIHVR